MTTAIQRAPEAPTIIQYSNEQRQLIRDMFARGANDQEFAALMAVAEAHGLNPVTRQVYFVKRYDSVLRREVWASQVSIDGFRLKAQRTGEYDGQDEPEYTYREDGSIDSARVRVYRKGVSRPFVGTARWDEYVQKTREGVPTRFWRLMGHVMIAKCAEALALRKAFPDELSGLYTDAEMMQAGPVVQSHAREVTRPQPVPADPPPRSLPTAARVGAEEGLAASRVSDPVIPFGKNKGTPVSALSDKQRSWYLPVFREKLEKDPTSRYADEWRELIAALSGEPAPESTPDPDTMGDAYEGPDLDDYSADGEVHDGQFDE